MALSGRLASAGAAIVLLGACNAAYLSSAYVGVAPQIVTAGCHDSYDVYDKRDGHKLLVVSPVGREYAGCGGGSGAASGGDAAAARFRSAAEHYVSEMRRGDCRILDGRAVTSLHHEFTYACASPEPKAGRIPVPRT